MLQKENLDYDIFMKNQNSNNYKNRNFIIFNVSELNLIDFDEVFETGPETIRKSIDGTKTFVKWEDKKPTFLNDLKTKEGPYTYTEMLDILNTSEWSFTYI